MLPKRITIACLMSAVAFSGATRAAADAGDALAGALFGGILGHAIAKDQQRKRTVVVRRAPSVSSAERQAARQMQTALNYFGFNAGSVDGAVGPGTRAAVSRYQSHMGYPVSGWIQPHEHDFLVAAHSWATSGGAATSAARTPQELLVAYRQRMTAPAPQMAFVQPVPQMAQPQPQLVVPPTTTVVVAPQAAPAPGTAQQTTTTTTTTVAAEAAPQEDAAPLSQLPSFMGADEGHSLASHCNQVSLLTSSNGGFMTAATLSDASFALDEQFCLARTYAIAEGEKLVANIAGVSASDIAEQCRAFGPTLKPYVSALSLRPGDEVLKGVAGFVLDSGMSPSQLGGTAKVCLSVGYRTDDMDVALGSALLLAALGERVYGELMGHHLVQGFGASQRPDLAAAWYQMGLDAVDEGGRAVFAPGQSDRQALIRQASAEVTGIGMGVEAGAAQPQAVLPTFAVQQ